MSRQILPYRQRSPEAEKENGRKRPPGGGGRAELPALYVKLGYGTWNSDRYAKVHLRVRGGKYRYLSWKDGGHVHTFYLGAMRNSCPTGADLRTGARQAPRRRRRRRKTTR